MVSLNWSNTFQLNGIVSHYDLRRNGILLSRNLATSLTLTQEPLEQGWPILSSPVPDSFKPLVVYHIDTVLEQESLDNVYLHLCYT